MQVHGNIASDPKKQFSSAGKPFLTFSLAENSGVGDNRKTIFYKVVAFINETDADLLEKGQFVKITGNLELEVFMRRSGEPGAEAKILAFSVQHVATKQKEAAPAHG